MTHAPDTAPHLQDCIDHCLSCYQHCQQTALTHCLQAGGKHVEPEHFRLMMDCAEVCRSAAALMLNGSPFHTQSCRLCADVCRACAESCEGLDGMEQCVAACERCAASCEEMAGSGMHTGTRQGQPAASRSS